MTQQKHSIKITKEMPVVMTKVNLLYSDVFNELKTIKNINILEMEERAEKWNIKIEISGNEENIVEVLDKLEFFDIKSYNIIGKDGVLLANLELYR